MKWLICGVVALAAVVTVAAHVSRSSAAKSAVKPQEYAAVIPTAAPVEAAKPVAEDVNWGVSLNSLTELNVVASNTDACFIVIPSSDNTRTVAVQKEVSVAAATITGRGSKMGTFLLSKDSPQYAGLVQQVGSPAVLAMYKGRGMAEVRDNEVNQEGLLKAFVGASRPVSSCCPSGGSCK